MSCIVSSAGAAAGSWPFNQDESLLLSMFFHLCSVRSKESEGENKSELYAVFVYFVYFYLRDKQ